MSNRNRHPWSVKVHADMLAGDLKLTALEIAKRFGRPVGCTSVALRMANAVKGGWFTTEPVGKTRFYRYVPVERKVVPPAAPVVRHAPEPRKFERFGRGFARVQSVFHLGAHL